MPENSSFECPIFGEQVKYNITDHLGNVRSVVNQSGTIEQATDYYPYGLSFSNNNLNKNRYLYNGKELQNQTLSSQFFGMYDYGARMYDPVIGRWMGVDPLTNDATSWSPYRAFFNNPLRFID
jgi:RHS repeat-associated protein